MPSRALSASAYLPCDTTPKISRQCGAGSLTEHSQLSLRTTRLRLTIEQKMLHHGVDYTPYEGMTVRNWPRYTILRGKTVWDRDNGGVVGDLLDGQFLIRKKGKIVVGKTGGEVSGMLSGGRDYCY